VNRLFWMGVGAAVGVWATRRTHAAVHAITPAGVGANIADGLRELGAGLGAFGAEVRAGMVDRERELAELVERRTGAGLPTVVDALGEPDRVPAPRPAPLPRRIPAAQSDAAGPRHAPLPRRIPTGRTGARARRAGA
jgi:hypothetical protein